MSNLLRTTSLKKIYSPSPGSHQLPIASQVGLGIPKTLSPLSMLEFWLASSCSCPMHAIRDPVSSFVQQYCQVE